MALKPTIYKAKISLSDLNRNYFNSLNLTIAQHPSETLERMMVRLLAFCLNASENLLFAKGLSATDEPDLIARTLDDRISLWIDVGEPAIDRIKKATRIAQIVKVYSFNTKSNVWWEQNKLRFSGLNVSVYQLNWSKIQTLVKLVQRTMDFSVTVSEKSAYFSGEPGDCEVTWSTLYEPLL